MARDESTAGIVNTLLMRCALALCFAACPVLLLAASSNLPSHGGNGGESFSLDCGDESVLVGMNGRTGDWLDSLQARCTRVSNDGTAWAGNIFTSLREGSGSGGKSSFTRTCPKNYVVKGISGRFGWYVNALTLRCAPLSARATGSVSTITAFGSQSGDNSFSLELCPDGRPARGFHGKAGDYVDRAGLICHTGALGGSAATPFTDPCRSIIAEIDKLRRELRAEKSDWQDGPRSRPTNAGKIRQLEHKYAQLISAKWRSYDRCLEGHGLFPDVAADLVGTATITTTKTEAPGPSGGAVNVSLIYEQFHHTTLRITNFPPIVSDPFPIPIPPFTNTVTVTLGGVLVTQIMRDTGSLSIALTLHFHHSAFGDSEIQDSDLDLTLTTDNVNLGGVRISPTTRQLTLAGSGPFRGGFLDGSTGTVVLTGTLSRLP